MSEHKQTILTISFVIIICLIALIAIIYTFIITINSLHFGKVEALEPDRRLINISPKYNYNFAIPEEDSTDNKVEQIEIAVQDNSSHTKVNYNFSIPDINQMLPRPSSIQIPAIGYNSPIIFSDDVNTGIDNGAWFYPTSHHPFMGESIFLCHRRFFKKYDPKSCWYLDKLQSGDMLYLNYENGMQSSYKITSISVSKSDDINIYQTSSQRIIKLISCSKENGQIGSDSHRIIIIAELVK